MTAFPFVALATSLTEFAPLIARWIGGKNSEEKAQRIVNIAKKVTGQSGPSSILDALKSDPKLVANLQRELMKIEQEMELSMLYDRQSARMRDIALAQSGRINLRADIMVVAAAAGLIGCLLTITLLKGTLPGEAVGIISTVAGIFGACLKDAYAFEFGSSRGSKLKDNKIEALMGMHNN